MSIAFIAVAFGDIGSSHRTSVARMEETDSHGFEQAQKGKSAEARSFDRNLRAPRGASPPLGDAARA
jgi:hypothetical protein